ncbi:MAG TPA: phage tail protein, partial [Actinophytocola sp.]|nr:phage tail protein [Actinophytocola sp.]
MGLSDASVIGLANRFVVSLSGKSRFDLGSWTKAEGLDVSWDIAEYRMGDGGNDRLYFPGNTKYTNVRLSRGASKDTDTVKEWLDSNSWKSEVFCGSIVLCSTHGEKVTSWDLENVM